MITQNIPFTVIVGTCMYTYVHAYIHVAAACHPFEAYQCPNGLHVVSNP